MAQDKWFTEATQDSKPLGWRKDMPQWKRIQVAVRNRRGNMLSAARALNALANVTTDHETKLRARADASYLYKQHKAQKSGRR